MILDKYTTFKDLVVYVNSFSDIKIDIGGHNLHKGIKLANKSLPISINEHEFNFIHDFILKHDLKMGYELATGIGISTLSAGIAFKKNNGKLISMDNYIEEKIQEQQISNVSNYIFEDSISYVFVKNVLEHFDLMGHVELRIGISPIDSINIFKKLDKKIDYVLIDCPKNDSDFERDFMSLIEYINNEKFVIFVHDTHTFTKKSFDLVNSCLGIEMKLIYDYYENTKYSSHRYFPLGIITNILI